MHVGLQNIGVAHMQRVHPHEIQSLMLENGVNPPRSFEHVNNGFCRYETTRRGRKDGYYRLFDTGIIYGDWYSDQHHVSFFDDKQATPQERQKFAQEAERYRQEHRAQLERQYNEIAEQARQLWDKADTFIAQSPYARRKLAIGFNVRVKNSTLLVPCYDVHGKLWSLQSVKSDGFKQFLKDGKSSGTFCPLDDLQKAETIIIAEGYATADTLQQAINAMDIQAAAVCAFNAGNLPKVCGAIRTKYKGKRIIVAGDDDVFTETGNAGRKYAEQCGVEAFFPVFKNLEEEPTDFNDLHVLEGLEAVTDQLKAVLYDMPLPDDEPEDDDEPAEDTDVIIQELNQVYALVGTSPVKILRETATDLQYWSTQSFTDYLANRFVTVVDGEGNQKRKKLGSYWLAHPQRRTYEGVIFAPDGDAPQGYYNLFTGWGVEARQGTCTKIIAHIYEVLCGGNPAYYDWLMDWLADIVQNPTQKKGTAVILRGGQGAGKSTLCQIMRKLLGKCCYTAGHESRILSTFNAHFERLLLLNAEEAVFAGDNKAVSFLKHLITSPTLDIERKGQDIEGDKPNYTRLLMTTNKDWAIRASADERRYFVLDVINEYAQNKEYFTALNHEIDNGGAEAFLHELLNRKIESDLRQPPRTTGLIDQIMASQKSQESFLFHLLECGVLPKGGLTEYYQKGNIVISGALYQEYVKFCEQGRMHGRLDARVFGRTVCQLIGSKTETRKINGKSTRILQLPNLSDARKAMVDKLCVEYDFQDNSEAWSYG